ncbi:hypothetical protein [Pseudomonas phage PA1C]|nr:hypothetical protein [Pseudomonas phage PA1C]BEG72567.1 hypothetical protein RVBP21_1950 [Pseudomonas phage BRkr]
MSIVSVKVTRKRKGVIHVPRGVGCAVNPGTNLISIEYNRADNYGIADGVNVFEIDGFDNPINSRNAELVEWVKACNGENIVVHCEMGMKRSKQVALWIIEHFGYHMMDTIEFQRPGDGNWVRYNRYRSGE